MIMLLNELFDTEDVSDNELRSRRGGHIGDGFHSGVYTNKDDPHTVIKASHNKSEDEKSTEDGYWFYINTVVEYKLATKNPHFPRVYKIDKKNKSCEVERLVSYKDLDDKLLLDYMFSVIKYDETQYDFVGKGSVAEKANLFVLSMAQSVVTKNYSAIRLPSLKAALQVIGQMEELNPKIILDFSLDNVMFRRTGLGIEVVFSDPFW